VTDGDLVQEAVEELYSCDPGEFTGRRGVLVTRARAAGKASAAKRIAGLRRPTQSAWVLNQLVRSAPAAVSQLAALGDELRAAQRSLDGAAIRGLSLRRRQLIGALASQAFTVSGQQAPSAALRDEVTATLGAAMADPQFAEQLRAGTLERAAHRDGFGPAAAPAATVLPSRPGRARTPARKDAPAASARKDAPAAPATTAVNATALAGARARAEQERRNRAIAAAEQAEQERRDRAIAAAEQAERERRDRAIAAAEHAVAEADQAAGAAAAAEREQGSAVRLIEEQLTGARQRLAEARLQARQAITAQRRARQALDRLREHPPPPETRPARPSAR
jgi:hypothetical protein